MRVIKNRLFQSMYDLENYCLPAIKLASDCNIEKVNVAFLDFLGYSEDSRVKIENTNLSKYSGEKLNNLDAIDTLSLTHKSGKVIKVKAQKIIEAEDIYIVSLSDCSSVCKNDPLTGAYARYVLEDDVTELCSRESDSFVLIGLGIKSFNNLNSTLGINVGDIVLQKTVERLKECCPENAKIFRSYADVFIVLLKGAYTKVNLQLIVKSILTKCESQFEVLNRSINCRFSSGVVIYPDSGMTTNDLLKHLDFSMGRSKDMGVTQFFYHDKLTEYKLYLRVVSDIEDAIAQKKFDIFYQPIVAYKDGAFSIVGAESLIRWFHDELKFIAPDYFIAIAEEMGVIDKINVFVFNKVLADLGQIDIPDECDEFKLSINLSLRVQNIPSHLIEISKIIRDYKHKNDKIKIQVEFTETAIFEDESSKQILRMFMRECRSHGVYFAMDDFGVEHSSINRLLEFNFDVIKIDKQFVQRIGGFDDTNTIYVIETILSLAKKLKYKVVAEGVEVIEQLEVLDNLDCDYYQGYYFYRPLSLPDFLDSL